MIITYHVISNIFFYILLHIGFKPQRRSTLSLSTQATLYAKLLTKIINLPVKLSLTILHPTIFPHAHSHPFAATAVSSNKLLECARATNRLYQRLSSGAVSNFLLLHVNVSCDNYLQPKCKSFLNYFSFNIRTFYKTLYSRYWYVLKFLCRPTALLFPLPFTLPQR